MINDRLSITILGWLCIALGVPFCLLSLFFLPNFLKMFIPLALAVPGIIVGRLLLSEYPYYERGQRVGLIICSVLVLTFYAGMYYFYFLGVYEDMLIANYEKIMSE